MHFRFFLLIISAVFLYTPYSCSSSHQPAEGGVNPEKAKPGIIRIMIPLAGTSLSGRQLQLDAVADTSAGVVDSLVVYEESRRIQAVRGARLNYKWTLMEAHAGRLRVSVRAFRGGALMETAQTSVLLLAEKAPREMSYTILRSYPHDSTAYTQGLQYENGWLFESTGQYRRSSLRRSRLATGEVEQSLNLPADVFGEGLSLFDDKLLQLSWKSKTGFVYEKESFRELRKVTYQTEGWGLCYDGQQFILSDGSEILYFMEKDNFSETGRLEVYDHKGPVRQINELEYIGGKIFANIYGENYIVVIDPETGFVTARLDLSKLVPASYLGNLDKALNGIAWIAESGHLLITGKDWPVVHELSIH